MKIEIDGIIGWDFDAREFKALLKRAKATEPLDITISSPGGSVFDAIEIFNAIRAHKGPSTATITSLAASAASYIFMAVDKRVAFDNAVFMIHNPWGFAIGDHREMRIMVDLLDGLASLLGKAYAGVVGATIKKIRGLMDAETWVFGDDIKEQGFADEIISSDELTDQAAAMASAKISLKAMQVKMQADEERFNADLQKCAALIPQATQEGNSQNPLTEKKENLTVGTEDKNPNLQGDPIMNLEEFKAKHPDLYNQVVQSGIDQERSRVNSHMKFLSKGLSAEYAEKAITSGADFDSEAMAHYNSEALSAKNVVDRVDDNPPDVDPEPAAPAATEDNGELLAKVKSYSAKSFR